MATPKTPSDEPQPAEQETPALSDEALENLQEPTPIPAPIPDPGPM